MIYQKSFYKHQSNKVFIILEQTDCISSWFDQQENLTTILQSCSDLKGNRFAWVGKLVASSISSEETVSQVPCLRMIASLSQSNFQNLNAQLVELFEYPFLESFDKDTLKEVDMVIPKIDQGIEIEREQEYSVDIDSIELEDFVAFVVIIYHIVAKNQIIAKNQIVVISQIITRFQTVNKEQTVISIGSCQATKTMVQFTIRIECQQNLGIGYYQVIIIEDYQVIIIEDYQVIIIEDLKFDQKLERKEEQ
ncbi:MAG: hypothetical protein EZS28_043596 [Streblomastix strix]|uniref:Uncharacterized protein n=1 Tax=Streblomastix strix TaxID=222440 RepID=A0A5J4TRJ5_9EUKA|nr:MAG: hypothetical protein EZS28_043596 [Streblomastix strix]